MAEHGLGTDIQGGIAATFAQIYAESGRTLLGLAEQSPVLLVFLRHFGCAFCRQAISDVADVKGELGRRGVCPVFVHLGTPERARPFFEYYGIPDVERVSDPQGSVYRNPPFALQRRHPAWQLVTPAAWRSWLGGSLLKHGVGRMREDGHQWPGMFLLRGPNIVRRYRYKTVADQPDYLKFVS